MINACLIVKDDSEAKSLHNALQSVIPYVDGIYVTANGEKVEEIEKLCSQDKKIHYSYLKWDNDFSKVRNFNFSQVPKNTDFIFWIDSDDILVGGEHLREVAEQAIENKKDVVFLTYWYGCRFKGDPSIENLKEVEMEHMRERLIRPGVINWVGRLHETPVPVVGAKNNYTSYSYNEKDRPIAIMHTASMDEAIHKMERNKTILEIQLEEERKKGEADPRTLLYLMKIYTELDDPKLWEKTIEMGKEYMKKSGWDEERGTCMELMAIVAEKSHKDSEIIEYLHEAIKQWPHNPLFYIRLATAYYNNKNYKAARHWLNVSSQMDLDNKHSAGLVNYKAMKVLYANLLLKIKYNVDKDVPKALEAAKLIYKEDPNEKNKEQMLFLADVKDLNDACKRTDDLARYLHSIGQDSAVPKLLDALPDSISEQPFAIGLRKATMPARKWGDKEICYFANFGQPHFEKWDGNSLSKGIGGSETAVIELSKEWSKYGYKVTVYGDPKDKGDYEGVTYLPYYYFNKNDAFNIFIQWRGWQLAGNIKCKKFLVDLHDIYSAIDLKEEQLRNIDKIMVKSTYHRELAPNIPDNKFLIISNGIQV